MTFPNALRDKLIFWPSFIRAPVAPVLLNLSLPAKSTKFNRLATYFRPYGGPLADYRWRAKSRWERDESLFIAVYPTALFFVPKFRNSINSSWFLACICVRSFTNTPFSADSFNSNLAFGSPSKSWTSSL